MPSSPLPVQVKMMTKETRESHPILGVQFPPSPPKTEDSLSAASSESSSHSSASSSDLESASFPLPPPSIAPVKVLDQDKNTPDKHVPRDPRLIRLTGVHPFNVEAPLSNLFNQGFLTSPELFYVRNHGPVPEVQDSEILDWEFTVEGLVQKPLKITLKDLLSDYDNVTYPVTLVCAGNRRKEQNIVRKTKGFSWGPAGVSTALFTGVVMSEVIRKARPHRKAKYVCMEGADKLPNGNYGTSVKLNWVMDPNRGIMLAHGMNGEMLRPDHGKPLRVVIPGQIGGRSVKWLKKLTLTAEPSDNWYHIYDNRVLPTSVSPEESANNPKWWMDERYAIYDLNNNSAIAYPAHGEQLCLVDNPRNYRLKGYAYAGGGKRISRVEISLDKAKTWRLAEISYPEDTYRDADPETRLFGGRLDMDWRESCFCWCFWHLDIPVSDLEGSKDILVRSMDEAMSIQPRDMYWSVLGMMNNPWYRVTISKENDSLRFEHPCQPALIPGGWMEKIKKEGGNLTNGMWGERIGEEEEDEICGKEQQPAEVKLTSDKINEIITIDELRKHDDDAKDPWFVVNGEVFDGTGFLDDHPGGAQSIISAAGTDATDEFMAIHSETAKAMMPDYHIGTLDEKAKAELSQNEASSGEEKDEDEEQRTAFLKPKSWTKAILHEKRKVSWDTRRFTFKLCHDEQILGLPTGQHVMMRLRDPVTREAIIRSYTPISSESQKGYFDILIKLYFDTREKKGGKMSQAIDNIPTGHTVDFKGPIGKFEYLKHGLCKINNNKNPRKINHLIMISGGSGITPIYRILRSIMQDEQDETKCVVINGNRLVEDILCREDLDRYELSNKHKCKLLYTLTQAPQDWKGLRGRIAAPLLEQHARVGEDSLALVCGPEALERSVYAALVEQGWKDEDMVFL